MTVWYRMHASDSRWLGLARGFTVARTRWRLLWRRTEITNRRIIRSPP